MKIHVLKGHRLSSMILHLITLVILITVTCQQDAAGQGNTSLQQKAEQGSAAATPLSFGEFFEPGTQELKPSAKLLALRGKRVRLVGFMAQMEEPPKGAFYLAQRPVFCDEEGGGNADLPAATVLVLLRSAKDKEIAFISGALEVTGILEIGNRSEESGQISAIRLILDGPQNSTHPERSTRVNRTNNRSQEGEKQ